MSNESGFAQDRRLLLVPTATAGGAHLFQLITLAGYVGASKNEDTEGAPGYCIYRALFSPVFGNERSIR